MTTTIDVAMLGPSGAGKTSLLASLYAEFPTVTEQTKLVLIAQDRKTSVELDDYRSALEAAGRQLVVTEPGIAGTRDFREHVFSLRDQSQTKGSHIDIRFSDYPGGWLTDPSTDKDPQLENRFSESDILIVAVDTPALLAEDGRFHHPFNKPQLVRDLVCNWVSERPRRLLLIVPLKSEKWAEDRPQALALAATVHQAYKALIDSAAAPDNRPAVVITPVHTIGSLVFDGYEVVDNAPQSRFRGISSHPRYQPRWTAEPLRRIVQHSILHRQERRRWWKKVADIFTGEEKDLREALDKLATLDLGPSLELS